MLFSRNFDFWGHFKKIEFLRRAFVPWGRGRIFFENTWKMTKIRENSPIISWFIYENIIILINSFFRRKNIFFVKKIFLFKKKYFFRVKNIFIQEKIFFPRKKYFFPEKNIFFKTKSILQMVRVGEFSPRFSRIS